MPLMTLMIGKCNCQKNQIAPVFVLVIEFDHTIRKALTGISQGASVASYKDQKSELSVRVSGVFKLSEFELPEF